MPNTTAESESLTDLVTAALSVTRDRPEETERTRVHIAICARIRVQMTTVQAQMAGLPERSRAWYARDTALDDARGWLAEPLSPSPMAAGVLLAELGRRLRALNELAQEEL